MHPNELLIGRKVLVLSTNLIGEVYHRPIGGLVELRFFAGPGREWLETVSIQDLSPAIIASQRRAWVLLDPGGPNELTQFVRVIAEVPSDRSPLRRFAVRFPSRNDPVQLHEDELRVDSGGAPADPFDNLLARGVETPFFFDMRDRLVRAAVAQRAICRGLTGLLSARIDLYRHQVEVVRRVLQDPLQRYLLADEVGLGKTIQAGCVIRQLRLDDPKATVLVLAPQHLMAQWREELSVRFGVKASSNPHDGVCVADYTAAHLANPPELLVIDEAHQLFASGDNALLNRMDTLAVQARRVLLLTATPVLGHEQEWLRLLSWLDPELYQNTPDDLVNLRNRIKERRDIGRELITLAAAAEELDAYPLRAGAERLAEMFGGRPFDDPTVVDLCNRVTTLLDADSLDESAVRRATASLRLYVGECYRLHRRMIRNRRRYLSEQWTVRTPQPIKDIYPDTRERVWQAFEQWRAHVAYMTAENPGLIDKMVPVFRALAESVGSWSPLAARVVEARLARQSVANADCWLFDMAVASGQLLDGEREHLEHLLGALQAEPVKEDRVQTVVAQLRLERQRNLPPTKTVVFTSFTATAHELARRLFEGPNFAGPVWLLAAGMQPDDTRAAFNEFQVAAAPAVLVVDRTGQEGWNLQFAHRLIHFDLPLDPFALEQRVGRLDRISRRRRELPILIVHTGLGNPAVDDAWLQFLDKGLRAFEEPISDLHLFLDRRVPKLVRAGLTDGLDEWANALTSVGTEVADERQLNAEADVLDAADMSPEDATRFFEPLARYEGEEDLAADTDATNPADPVEEFRDAVVKYFMANNINRERFQRADVRQRAQFHATHDVLLREDWFDRLRPHLTKNGVWTRMNAVTYMDPDRPFYRLGEPLVDLIMEFSRLDDRGQSFLAWKVQPGRVSEGVFVQVNVVVESDLHALRNVLGRLALPAGRERELVRLADFFLPPRYESFPLTADGHPVTDAADLAALKGPYHGTTKNLASPEYIHLLNRVIGTSGWQTLVNTVRHVAPERVATDVAHAKIIARGLEDLDAYFTRRTSQLEVRRRNGMAEAEEELAAENMLWEAMRSVVSSPSIRVDAVGVLILSGTAVRPPAGAV